MPIDAATPEPTATPESQAAAPARPQRRPRLRHRMHTAQEAREWRRRMAVYGVIAISFVLAVNALVGENGYLAGMRARREYAELADSLRRVREENQAIRDQIQRLREDPAALEEAARRDLRLSKPGETMVVIKNAPTPKAAPVK